MRGYLYVQEEVLGKLRDSFCVRYFVSFQFCGLKWFLEEPKESNSLMLLQQITSEQSGWVYGSNVWPHQVQVETPIQVDTDFIYPFKIVLKADEAFLEIVFAVDDAKLRDEWVKHMQIAMQQHYYISSSNSFAGLPNCTLFRTVCNVHDGLVAQNTGLDSTYLSAIINFYKLTASHGILLQSLLLRNVGIDNQHVAYISSIASFSTYLENLCLSENLLTSKGLKELCSTLVQCRFLTRLDLSNNLIGDHHIDSFCRTVSALPNLQHLDLSRNRLTELSVKPLTLQLATHNSKLQTISFAYNRLTDKIASFVSLLLFNQPSHVTAFDLSFCGLTNNGIKELAQALPYCTTLRRVSLLGAYTDGATLRTLIEAINAIRTNNAFRVRVDPDQQRSTDNAVEGRFHRSIVGARKQSSTGLVISIGGILQECFGAAYLKLDALKPSLPYLSELSSVSAVVLRRRCFPALEDSAVRRSSLMYGTASDQTSRVAEAEAIPVSHIDPAVVMTSINAMSQRLHQSAQRRSFIDSQKRVDSNSQTHPQPQATVAASMIDSARTILQCPARFLNDVAVLCVRCELPAFVASIEEVLSCLAVFCGADLSQFKVLSVSHVESDAKPLCFIIFTVLDLGHSAQLIRGRQLGRSATKSLQLSILKKYQQLHSKAHHDAHYDDFQIVADAAAIDLRMEYFDSLHTLFGGVKPAAQLVRDIEELARQSHPILHRLGFRSVFLQYSSNSDMRSFELGDPNPESAHPATDAADPSKDIDRGSAGVKHLHTRNYHTAESGSISHGLKDHFFPHVTPKPQPLVGRVSATLGGDTEHMLDMPKERAEPDVPVDVAVQDRSLPFFVEEWDSMLESADLCYEHFYKFANRQATADAQTVTDSTMPSDIHNSDPILAAERRIADAAKMAAVAAQRRKLRLDNERLVLAVRNLYKCGVITSDVSKFWEGAIGNLKYKDHAKRALPSALEEVSGMYKGVRRRQLLCDAMMRRDQDDLLDLIEQHRANPTFDGGTALTLAHRLAAEVVGLHLKYQDLVVMVKTYNELHLIEDFLLSCGKVGYAGTEMFQAVELRQAIVQDALEEVDQYSVLDDLPHIKMKAQLSNLMISRNLEQLEEKLASLQFLSSEDPAHSFAETVAAMELLAEHRQNLKLLDDAANSGDIIKLEESVAIASYYYFYSEKVVENIATSTNMSKNPIRLLQPILEALRNSEMTTLVRGFEMLNYMGWRHPALDAVICSKLFTEKSKILQDDSLKSKIINMALGIRNGFEVKPGELGQVLRRAAATGIDQEPGTKSYVKTLSKHMKKFSGTLKQEREIQTMIDQGDIKGLSKLLSGRGIGKLVMCASGEYAMEEWLALMKDCCTGKLQSTIKQAPKDRGTEDAVFMTGFLDKAARTDVGLVRAWRRRYFVLTSKSISYFTKEVGGTQKGCVLALNGSVRRLEPLECGGRQFCFELEEGRDLTVINPDLLDEAKRLVQVAKSKEITHIMKKGIEIKSLKLLERMLKAASDLEIMLDFDLVSHAKYCIAQLQEKELMREMHVAAALAPKERLHELVALAEKLHFDPNVPSYRRVLLLSRKSELFQALYRARGALSVHDESIFRKAFRHIARYELKHLTLQESELLVAVILQYCGYKLLQLKTLCYSNNLFTSKVLKFTLTLLSTLLVESEPMDLCRLLINLSTRSLKAAFAERKLTTTISVTGRTDKVSGLGAYLDEFKTFSVLNQQYNLLKYSRLRVHATHEKGFFFSLSNLGMAFKRNKKKASVIATSVPINTTLSGDILSFTDSAISKSLLKELSNDVDGSNAAIGTAAAAATTVGSETYNKQSVEAFAMLQVVMGDRSLSSLSRPKRDSLLTTKTGIEEIVLDLVDAGAVRYLHLRDELYVQLAKQLTLNSSIDSCRKGWTLFSLYLHGFYPSQELYPYLRNFVAINIERYEHELAKLYEYKDTEEAQGRLSSVQLKPESNSKLVSDVYSVEEELALKTTLLKLCCYCEKLLSMSENQNYEKNASRTNTSSCSSSIIRRSADVGNNSLRILKHVMKDKSITVNLVLMTGSLYQVSVPFAHIDTAFSLFCYLFDQLVGLPKPQSGSHALNSITSFLSLDTNYRRIVRSGPNAAERDENEVHVYGDEVIDLLDATDEHIQLDDYHSRTVDNILSLFRGISLYTVAGDQLSGRKSETRSTVSSSDLLVEAGVVDLQKLPVQPLLEQLIDWHQDIQWDLVSSSCNETVSGNVLRGGSDFDELSVLDESEQPVATFVLRRTIATNTEPFCDEFDLFSVQPADEDVSTRFDLWVKWLQNTSTTELPSDADRIDLLFAEDSRYVNSRLYPLSDESYLYLLSIQVALCWEPFEADEWAINCGIHRVVRNATLSVRPCQQRRALPAIQTLAHRPTGNATGHESYKFHHRGSTISLRGVPGIDDLSVTNEPARNSDSDSSDYENAANATDDASYETANSDDGPDDDQFSYVSSEDTVDSADYIDPKTLGKHVKMTSYESLIESQGLSVLTAMLKSLGVDQRNLNVPQFVAGVAQIHNIATIANVPTGSAKYRYLLKRAYLRYLMATPLYGYYFSNAIMISSELKQLIHGIEKDKEVIVGISVSHLLLLDKNTWEIVFQASLCDIQSCVITSTENFMIDASVKGTYTSALSIGVNGLQLDLLSDRIHEILHNIERRVFEMLGRGCFPHGSEGGDDIFDSTENIAMLGTSGNIKHASGHAVHAVDPKEMLTNFLHQFPMMPRPPVPTAVCKSSNYFEAPKSKRALHAEARQEEERMEFELARLAAEAHVERNQQQMQQGRADMKRYQGGDEDDDLVSDHSPGGTRVVRERASVSDKKPKRKNRSIIKGFDAEEIRQQILRDRQHAVVCGVSNRMPRDGKHHIIPTIPTYIGGSLKTDVRDKRRVLKKPVIDFQDVSVYTSNELSSPLPLSWSNAAAKKELNASGNSQQRNKHYPHRGLETVLESPHAKLITPIQLQGDGKLHHREDAIGTAMTQHHKTLLSEETDVQVVASRLNASTAQLNDKNGDRVAYLATTVDAMHDDVLHDLEALALFDARELENTDQSLLDVAESSHEELDEQDHRPKPHRVKTLARVYDVGVTRMRRMKHRPRQQAADQRQQDFAKQFPYNPDARGYMLQHAVEDQVGRQHDSVQVNASPFMSDPEKTGGVD